MKGMIANLLKIKPIITLRNSTIDKVDIAKSYTSATEKILNFLKLKFEKIKKPISKIVILITNTTPKEKIEFIKDSITQKFSFIKSKILIRIIPNVFLVHT
jgi:fatty acid-binding protein DegV